MPKVTVHDEPNSPTPSEEFVKAAMLEETVTDARGRRLHMRKPGVLAQYRLTEALGDLASNDRYAQMCLPLIYLGSIDDEPIFMPKSKLEIEALIQRLDEDGLQVVMSWWLSNIVQPSSDAVDAAMRAKEQKAAIKN